ncbi:hypothetical protein PIB30_050927 [Stylosanthes scabra]|uniref:SCP domain-containing protein n=1 Tax=Stylosanthes scabra TaxID=79078 RepID=A0ABU6QH39_9FABA|nr:hypothetical protein [Stylosanthes scabra]
MEMLHILIMVITSFVSIFPLYLLAGNTSPGEYLRVHNDARAIVGTEPLIWDDKLEEYAQAFVHYHRIGCLDEVSLADPPHGYGQNIGRIPKDHAALYAVRYWVALEEKYDYKNNTCIDGRHRDDDCLVYVQIVTKGTTHLGCASTTCHNDKDKLVTCYYNPHGMVPNERPY